MTNNTFVSIMGLLAVISMRSPGAMMLTRLLLQCTVPLICTNYDAYGQRGCCVQVMINENA